MFRQILFTLTAAAVAALMFGPSSAPAAVITTLDGTSGSNTIGTGYSTDGGLDVNLGFFADVLVVGGGGSGGSDLAGGGGGAGGLIFKPGHQVSGSTSVTVGAGGSSVTGTSARGNSGENSVFGGLTALGGGGGGEGGGSSALGGKDGGSGGGGGGDSLGSNYAVPGGSSLQSSLSGDSGAYGHGNAGAVGQDAGNDNDSIGGGGGGAGAAGTSPFWASGMGWTAGAGGDGLSEVTVNGTTYNFDNIFGSTYSDSGYFAGGGAGGSVKRSALHPDGGGLGGGGDGGKNAPGSNASANTGGGGGGAGNNKASGAGGSGIVMLRYAGDAVTDAGSTPTTVNGQNVHTYTGGSSSFDLSGVDMNARLGATLTGQITGSGELTFNGPGTLTLTGDNTYEGGTTVSAGTLRVNNTTGSGTGSGEVTVASGAAFGGYGAIDSALTFNEGANFWWDGSSTLTVSDPYTVSLHNTFGIESLAGFDWADVGVGTYTLIANNNDNSDFSSITNWGSANAYTLGDGRKAYFSEGSLLLNVVPEPGTGMALLSLLSVSACALLVRRRRR